MPSSSNVLRDLQIIHYTVVSGRRLEEACFAPELLDGGRKALELVVPQIKPLQVGAV